MARSLWPESSGATSGSSAERSVERSTSMYATTSASLVDHTVCSARPRPASGIRSALSPGSHPARAVAIAHVPSVLPLSAIVTRAEKGNEELTNACSRRMLAARSRSSL